MKIGSFTAIFLLTQHFSVFQIISRNWKHLINDEVQAKKVFWNVILHSSLCNASCKFFIKIESNQCFCKTYSESSKKEIVLLRDCKELFVQRFVEVFDRDESTWRPETKEQTTQMTLSYCDRTVRSSHRRLPIQIVVLKNFAIFTRKNLRWGLLSIKFFKNRLHHRCFSWILQNF